MLGDNHENKPFISPTYGNITQLIHCDINIFSLHSHSEILLIYYVSAKAKILCESLPEERVL